MKSKTPEELNSDTPNWFKEWRNNEFWHFKERLESRLSLHSKLIWIVLGTIIVVAISRALM